MIYLKYEGVPVGKGRPRATIQGGFTRIYTPKETKRFEEEIKFEFMKGNCEQIPVYPRDVALRLNMVFAFPVPKSYSKKKRKECLLGLVQHTKKPDADNVAKAVCDALNGYAFEDDSQITVMVLEKIYAEEPYVEVKIYPAERSD